MANDDSDARLRRLFADDGRCAIGMFDHGLFGEPSWFSNHSQIAALIAGARDGGLDALSLPAGSAGALGALPDPKPALVMRADTSDFWRGAGNAYASVPLPATVEDAARLGAACVITTIIASTSNPGLQAACLRTVDAVRAAALRHSLPVMIEAVAFDDAGDALTSLDDLETVGTLARQAFELGADVVKVEPTADAGDFGEVVAAAGGVPVLAGSGATVGDEEVVRRTATLIGAGAAGIGYGGNFLRAADVQAMTREVAATVHAPRSAGEGR